MYADVDPYNFTSFWRHNSHAFFLQARLTLGERHEVVCDVARRLSDFAIQQKHYDRVRTRTHLKSHLHKNKLHIASETKCSTICTPFANDVAFIYTKICSPLRQKQNAAPHVLLLQMMLPHMSCSGLRTTQSSRGPLERCFGRYFGS
jgi:hypothetical protein